MSYSAVVKAKPTMEMDYTKRIKEELQSYKDYVNIHKLPGIHLYWGDKFLLPITQLFGFPLISDIYLQYMLEACIRTPESRVNFLSLGAGNCELEVRLASRLKNSGKSNFIIECLDINSAMLSRGRQLAADNNVLDVLNFKDKDLNSWNKELQCDIIIASQCLHHFVELEAIFDRVYEFLSPHGYFIAHDMIGRNGHLRWPEALACLQEFWDLLPGSYKYNHQLKRQEDQFMDWDCSVSGFEGIRAQDILPLLVERFQFELFIGWGGVIDVFIDRSFGHNFNADSEWDCKFIDRVHEVNLEKLIEGTIKPTQMIAVMSKTDVSRKLYWQNMSPKASIRLP